MNHHIQFVTSVLVLASGMAFAGSQSSATYTQADVRSMIRSAHSTEQYQALASYFRTQQQALEKKALAEKAEWERRNDTSAAVFQKYPRPVDSSRSRYEYFTSQANEMGKQAAHYEGLTGGSQQSASR